MLTIIFGQNLGGLDWGRKEDGGKFFLHVRFYQISKERAGFYVNEAT